MALVDASSTPAIPGALPAGIDDSAERLIARLHSALRIQHPARRRAASLARGRHKEAGSGIVPPDLLEESTVLAWRAAAPHPALSLPIAQRAGLMGALSIDTAARYLNGPRRRRGGHWRWTGTGRDRSASDPARRERSVSRSAGGVLNNATADDERLPNLVRVGADPARLVERILPFVRLHALRKPAYARLESARERRSDLPDTGLFAAQAFWRNLERAVRESEKTGSALSVARFTFEGLADRRAYVDAARLFSRLVRNTDFVCRSRMARSWQPSPRPICAAHTCLRVGSAA